MTTGAINGFGNDRTKQARNHCWAKQKMRYDMCLKDALSGSFLAFQMGE